MSFKLSQLLVSHSFSLCSIIIPTFLLDRTNFRSSLVGELMSLSLHWGSCLAIGGSHLRFHIPTVRSLSWSHPHILLWKPPQPRSMTHSRNSPHPTTPASLQIQFILLSLWHALLFFPTLVPEQASFPFPSLLSLSFFSPSASYDYFIYLSKWDSSIPLGLSFVFSLFEFVVCSIGTL